MGSKAKNRRKGTIADHESTGRNASRFIASVIALSVLVTALSGIALAESISLSPSACTVAPGSATAYDIVLDSAPEGLAGYEIEVSIAEKARAEIVSAAFPSWASSLSRKSDLPADSVRLSGVDVNRQVQAGASNVVLVTITVRGDRAGSSGLEVKVLQLDADGGDVINAQAVPDRIEVAEGQGATPAPAAGLLSVAGTILAAALLFSLWRRR